MYSGLNEPRVVPGLPCSALGQPLLGDKTSLTEVDLNRHTSNCEEDNLSGFSLCKTIAVVILACAG